MPATIRLLPSLLPPTAAPKTWPGSATPATTDHSSLFIDYLFPTATTDEDVAWAESWVSEGLSALESAVGWA
jgi:hypothetical protein